MTKPFSTYPEDHTKMLALADAILNVDDEDNRKAIELADIVQSILRDEAIAEGKTMASDRSEALEAENERLRGAVSKAEIAFEEVAKAYLEEGHDHACGALQYASGMMRDIRAALPHP